MRFYFITSAPNPAKLSCQPLTWNFGLKFPGKFWGTVIWLWNYIVLILQISQRLLIEFSNLSVHFLAHLILSMICIMQNLTRIINMHDVNDHKWHTFVLSDQKSWLLMLYNDFIFHYIDVALCFLHHYMSSMASGFVKYGREKLPPSHFLKHAMLNVHQQSTLIFQYNSNMYQDLQNEKDLQYGFSLHSSC